MKFTPPSVRLAVHQESRWWIFRVICSQLSESKRQRRPSTTDRSITHLSKGVESPSLRIPMKTSTILEVLAAFNCDKPQYLNNMDPSDPFTQRARLSQDLFTGGVHALRIINNPIISGLMSYVWDIFHHRHVLMAMGPDVPTLSFAVAGKDGGGLQALVFAPYNWPDMVKEDPLMQLGAIIANGSQSADFYNGLINSPESIDTARNRANSYEAEFLLMLDSQLNEYQKGILAAYPKGFDPILGYVRKPIVATN